MRLILSLLVALSLSACDPVQTTFDEDGQVVTNADNVVVDNSFASWLPWYFLMSQPAQQNHYYATPRQSYTAPSTPGYSAPSKPSVAAKPYSSPSGARAPSAAASSPSGARGSTYSAPSRSYSGGSSYSSSRSYSGGSYSGGRK